jgi:hypothetical protein
MCDRESLGYKYDAGCRVEIADCDDVVLDYSRGKFMRFAEMIISIWVVLSWLLAVGTNSYFRSSHCVAVL